MDKQIDGLIGLRRKIHKFPELSGNEKETSALVKKYISAFHPDEIIENLGGCGVAFVFKGRKKGPTVLFRAELDALPIHELNQFPYRSSINGVSHKCGHDGHIAILSGLAGELGQNPPAVGRVVLLFQPAEETGQGAKAVLDDPKFHKIASDYVFALHNLPGFPMNTVLVKDNVFSSASIGLIVKLKGITSHASEPEKGLSPAFAMASILNKFKKYAMPGKNPDRIKIITTINARLGEKAFGTNPGYGEMMFTLRATHPNDFENLKSYAIDNIERITHDKKLQIHVEWVEEFPSSKNDKFSNVIVRKAAKQAGLSDETIIFPFRWSEDFGHFLNKCPGALFGLGSGTNQPALHNPDYDFPDELIKTGIHIFSYIYKIILK